ncbi:MAG: hypothetical protein K8S27_12130 [Candidatus Omnitrophica bacterium]|nr:hypothetical protein [Candidatus Omnitrophota bacterium]
MLRKRMFYGILFFICCVTAVEANQKGLTTDQVLADIKQKTDNVKTIITIERTRYYQGVNNNNFIYKKIWAQKPNILRTETNADNVQSVYILDGQFLWSYEVGREKILKRPYDTSQVLSFCFADNLKKNAGFEGGLFYVRKDMIGENEVYLIEHRSHQIVSESFEDHQERSVHEFIIAYYIRVADGLEMKHYIYDSKRKPIRSVEYESYQVNVNIPREIFTLSIPEGAQVVESFL